MKKYALGLFAVSALIAGGLLVTSGHEALANPPGTGQCDNSACSLCDHQFPAAVLAGDYQRSDNANKVIRVVDNGEWVGIQKVKSDGSLGRTRRFIWVSNKTVKKVRKDGRSVNLKWDSPAQITQSFSTNCTPEPTTYQWFKI